jgi:hypothetical protein
MEHIYILKEWSYDGYNWGETPLAVSVSKEKLADLASREGGPLLDEGETVEDYCVRRNNLENRQGRHMLSPFSFDSYLIISTIRLL